MADAGYLRPTGDEPGHDWHDWNCHLAPRAPTARVRGRRSRRFNPHHDKQGQFASGHGGGPGIPGVQPHPHQVNPPTPDGASTAHGHDIKGEVPDAHLYAHYGGPEVYGVAIPPPAAADGARIDRRIAQATSPPKGHKNPDRWPGRDEEDVHDHVLKGHPRAEDMDLHVRNAADDELAAALRHPREGKANARGLAYARAIGPAIDRKVKAGELVRTFEDFHHYAITRLRPRRAGEVIHQAPQVPTSS